MVSVVSKPGTLDKLKILSADAQYDLACACGSQKNEHRKRGADGRWIYPVTLANGQSGSLFRTLVSNSCVNDCKYCPLRANSNIQRCSLTPEETARAFIDFYDSRMVFGAFLTSGVTGNPDSSMARLIETADIIRRRHDFRGYMHLKVIPGASDSAIEEAVKLASALSINIEAPGRDFFSKLSEKKDFDADIIRPLKKLAALTGPGAKYEKKSLTTQFIVGPAGETDRHLIHYTEALYQRLHLHRVYFSAYQKELGDSSIEMPAESSGQIFTREHRLYQADYLLRKYGFSQADFIFDPNGNFSMENDPKQAWADANPGFFPLDINKASKWQLLRIPGFGPETVRRIIKYRAHDRIRAVTDIAKLNKRLYRANLYLRFD
ncbi:MAG: hypothetical protein A2Y07_00005 [Planctomycetes bacterium GWF2_50_10]|nr:MAG: hypothetical protein A2Y07_00005 [Planctomycetes bacterium GWF2_50_10]